MKSLKRSPNREKSQALATYLFWLKTGIDYKTIAKTVFSLDNFLTVAQYCEQERSSLMKDFVSEGHVGAKHLSRIEWTKQNTLIP